MIIRINYEFQKKDKYLKISIAKDLIKQKNQTKKLIITESKNKKTDDSQKKGPVDVLNEIKKG